jgi:hypothetical protein
MKSAAAEKIQRDKARKFSNMGHYSLFADPGEARGKPRACMSRCCCHQRVRPLHYATPELARELKIPDMEKPGQFLWPPPQPNLALQMIAAIRPDPFIISEAAKGTYIEERNRRILEDNRRQIAEAEQRQREREQRKAAEMAKIKEADHMGRAAG